MVNREPAFAQQLDAWERATRNRGNEPSSRGTDTKATQVGSRGTRETPAQHRAQQQQTRAFAAKLKAAEDPGEKKFDRLEEALRRRERELAGAAAGAVAGTVVSSHRGKAKQAKDRDWKKGDWGVGFGNEWANHEAIEAAKKALKLKEVPDEKDPKSEAFWNEYWRARAEIVKPLLVAKLEEMSCLTMMQKPLESYARASGKLSQDHGAHEQQLAELIKQAHDARPYPADVQDARGTVVLEELRKQFGFESVHVDALKGDPKEYWNNRQINPKTKRPFINYSSDADARKDARLPKDKNHRTVEGKDSHQKIDVSVGIDHFVKLGGKTTAESGKWWKVLKETEFAVGVADQGWHTFAISRGFVYEVHWKNGPDDPELTSKRTLEDFFRPDNRKRGIGWGSGIIAVPPEALSQKTENKGR
jgi:hypothetical protein